MSQEKLDCQWPRCNCASRCIADGSAIGSLGELTGLSKLQREGDQQAPVPNNKPAIQDLVMQDMLARKLLGQKRYGTPLQPHNGRDMMQDLYEELLDACNYIRGAIYERDGK